MRCLSKLLALFSVLIVCGACWAQAPKYKNIGRSATPEEIRAWDISIGPSGKELPAGSGTAIDGAKVYAEKCAVCHGAAGEGGIGTRLVGGQGTLTSAKPVKTVGSFWPFATTVYDVINRTMPYDKRGSLSPTEVYSLTAFLLYKNGIIKESDVIDAKSLPKIQMPNRNGFIPVRVEDIPDIQKRGCQIGNCP